MSELEWVGQPKELECGEVVAKFFTNSKFFEVRKAPHDVWYVSVGNLFGSESVKCYSPQVAFNVIGLAANHKGDEKLLLPLGAELLDA